MGSNGQTTETPAEFCQVKCGVWTRNLSSVFGTDLYCNSSFGIQRDLSCLSLHYSVMLASPCVLTQTCWAPHRRLSYWHALIVCINIASTAYNVHSSTIKSLPPLFITTSSFPCSTWLLPYSYSTIFTPTGKRLPIRCKTNSSHRPMMTFVHSHLLTTLIPPHTCPQLALTASDE